MLRWQQESGVDWHYIQPGKPIQNAFVRIGSFASVSSSEISGRYPNWGARKMQRCTTIFRQAGRRTTVISRVLRRLLDRMIPVTRVL